ncbi:hypothetical protein GAMM_90032 [Gammaproteobacteria bacterium]
MKAIQTDLLLEEGPKKAVAYFGSEAEWARQLKIRKQKLNYWIHYGTFPIDQAMQTCMLTKGYVRPAELRPDRKHIIENYNKFIKDEKTQKS